MIAMTRYFSVIRYASPDGGFVAARDDGVGRVFISQREAEAAGALVVGDRVEHGLIPGGIGVDVLLDRRARHLPAQQAAK